MPYDDIYKGYREATRGLEEQAVQERERVTREYDTQRERLQEQLAESEREVQRTLGELRSAERREQRRADLPYSRPRDIATRENVEAVRAEGERFSREVRDLQGQVSQARSESLTDIQQQVSAGKAKIKKWYREAKAAQRKADRAAAKAEREARATAQTEKRVVTATAPAKYQATTADPFAGATARGQTQAAGPFAGATARGKATVPKSIIGAPLIGRQREVALASQPDLKAEYERYEAMPWWQKLYTDRPVVKVQSKYVPLVTGYAPAIAPAQRVTSAAKLSPTLKKELGSIVDDVIARAKGNIIRESFTSRPSMAPRTWETEHADAVSMWSHLFTESAGKARVTGLSAKQRQVVSALNSVLQRVANNRPTISITPRAVKLTSSAKAILRTAGQTSAVAAKGAISALALQAAVDASAKGMTMPKIRQATQQAVVQMQAVAPRAGAAVSAATVTEQALKQLADIQAKAASEVSARIREKPSIATVPAQFPGEETKTLPQTKTEPLTETETPVKPITRVVTTTRVPETPTKQPPPHIPPPPPEFALRLPDGTTVKLTPQQYAGIVAWRQGLFYILVYPPYGKAQTVYTRKPIAGIRYARGPESPQRSAAVIGGKLPRSFEVAMGITKVRVTPKTKAQPRLVFRSRAVPELGEIRKVKKHGRR